MLETIHEVDGAFPWLFPTFVAVFGACVGSFLNVVIYRIPAGRSVVSPGSTCSCGCAIAWYDNLPILSWFLRRGRARCCGSRFSIRYPLVELLTAVLFWGAWQTREPLASLVVMGAIGMLISAAFIDLDTMEIPDVFSIGGFIAGVTLSGLVPSLHGYSGDFPVADALRGVLASVQGAFIGSGLILWFALVAETVLRKEAMGFGDVKLMGAIGAFFGWQGAVFALFGGAVMGTVVLLPIVVRQRLRGSPPPGVKGSSAEGSDEGEEDTGWRVPFGPALVAGAFTYTLLLERAVDQYFADFATVLFGG